MNDAAELERKRLERFLSGGGKKAPPVSFNKKNTGSDAAPATTSPKPSTTTTSLGSSPSYKHEEKRKWEIKQERGRAEFAAAASATGKKHLEMEDSAAEAAARRSVGVSGGAAVNVESYEERERRRRAEWKRQASPSLALLDLLEGDADDQSDLKSRSAAPGKVAAAPVAKGASKPAPGGGVRSASEEAALKELLSFNSDTAQQTTKKNNEASSLSSSSSSSSSNGGVRLSPRLEDKKQTADTFEQIGNVLNSLNDLLDDGDRNSHAKASPSSAPTSVGTVDSVSVSGLPAAHSSGTKSKSGGGGGGGGRANAKPKTKEERRLAKEARRPEWAQTLYQEFEEDETDGQREYEYVDQQLWKVDLDQEELESKEFVKDARDGIQKLEAVSAMIEPDMDVDDFDEERFSLGIKEFVYSGKKTIRYIKRKSKQGSVRMAGEAKKFMDDSVALMDTARDYKTSRTEKAKAKFSRTVRKVKEGAQKLTKTVSNAVEDEVERMRELREKIRAAERDRQEREREETEARESRKAAAEREASVTRLSFDLDQFLYRVKKIEDDAFRFDYGGAVDLLKRVRDVKESVPVLLAYLSGAAAQKFTHLNAEITEISTATARFVKDWQAGGSSKAENMRQTGNIVKMSRKFQQNLMDLILFI